MSSNNLSSIDRKKKYKKNCRNWHNVGGICGFNDVKL